MATRPEPLAYSSSETFRQLKDARLLRGAFVLVFLLSLIGLLLASRPFGGSFVVGIPGSLLFVCALLSGALVSVYAYRQIREQFVLINFASALEKCDSPQECYRAFTDFASTLMRSSSAVLIFGDKRCEIISQGLVKEAPLSRCARALVATEMLDTLFETPKVRGAILREHDLALDTTARAIGELRIRNGLLLDLATSLATPIEHIVGVTKKGEFHFSARAFIPLQLPILPALLRSEAEIFSGLAGQLELRMQTFAERRRVLEVEQASVAANSQRDYELSTLVHEINNTVQDLTLLCEGAHEQLGQLPGASSTGIRDIEGKLGRVVVTAKSMGLAVSDVKRRRELEGSEEISPIEKVALSEIVKELTTFGQVRGERRRISILESLPQHEQCWVKVSARDHLETVLRDLLSHSISYSKPGTSVALRLEVSEEWVWLTLTDTGPGLSQEEIRLLLDGGVAKGSILSVTGSAVVREVLRYLEAQGGTFEISSPGPALGSVYTVMLPLEQPPLALGRKRRWALIVDDELSLANSLARLVRALQLETEVTGSAVDARRIAAERGAPQLVLTDLHLKDGTGFELARDLRASFGDRFPILLISGQEEAELSQRASELGISAVITKPIAQRALFTKLEQILTTFAKTESSN